MDQRIDGLPPATIETVREDIAGAFRDKLEVNVPPNDELNLLNLINS